MYMFLKINSAWKELMTLVQNILQANQAENITWYS